VTDELTLEPPGGKRKRKVPTPQEKLDSGSPTVRLEGAFQLAYEKQWGFPYFQTSPAEDRKHLAQMHAQLGEETACGLIAEFFAAVRPVAQGGDPVVSRCRHSNVRDFAFHAQYLLLRRKRGAALADRTADNVSEIMKATGRTRR